MNGFELNKIVASILLSSLIIMLIAIFTDVLYKPVLEAKHRGYRLDIIDNDMDVELAHNIEPRFDEQEIATLMKSANAKSGSKIFSKCATCHTINKSGPNRIGPNLFGIIEKPKAKHEGYKYSAAMIAKGGNWDLESLFLFLHKPFKYIRGTKMSFVGLSKPQDIADVIEFLRISASETTGSMLLEEKK